jgi:putative DNA methylase
MTDNEKRLIEDYLPIAAISAEASREKSVRKGHISTLHLWWARRPLVACRAAVYGALVPANRFVPGGASEEKKKSLGRANAAKFVERLCKYPGDHRAIAEAQRHILESHAERLTRETGEPVTVEDIEAGRAPRPKVLDMFAGGGAIPLEALRLGCEAHALDLNPVAHIIQLCTLVYPQKYGKPDPTARGMTGPRNEHNETTWGGLAAEVRYWGEWVLTKVKTEIGDLYPLIPDPTFRGKRAPVKDFFGTNEEAPPGYLVPVAYLWTRTVTCKNPTCKAIVPLLRQTWLCKKKDHYVALKMIAPKSGKKVRFEVVESTTEKGLGFDPTGFSKAGNATCPFCGTVADDEYVRGEGNAGRMGLQPMAVVATEEGVQGKRYLSADSLPASLIPDDASCRKRISELYQRTGLTVPEETINPQRPSPNARGLTAVCRHGILRFADLFTPRQLLSLLAIADAIRAAGGALQAMGQDEGRTVAICTFLACNADKQADRNSAFCNLLADGGRGIKNTFSRQALSMTWDFAEANPFNPDIASWESCFKEILWNIEDLSFQPSAAAHVSRGPATALSCPESSIDTVVTDPPYYDNVPYADISDYFYVWLKRNVARYFPEHFATPLTPKKAEATALASRHGGDMRLATAQYESMMFSSFCEANRVLKPNGSIVVVYAHKTTLGWSTLVDALRRAGFVVTEAWPLDTETRGRLVARETAALASSIFLVGRKRDGQATGSYETDVRPELEAIVRERVETLWDQGVSGADLVIACVGAGLRPFTRFARVEYANGDEVPAERFLTEVETVVLDSILARLSKEAGGNGGRTSLAGVDPATRFYTLWRYTYRLTELDAGEAIVFANGTHVELDGPNGMSSGSRALVEKKKGKYGLRDFAERGGDDHLGIPSDDAQPAPLIDALHRTLWLMEHRPKQLGEFLREAQPNREQMRLVAHALAGPALKGGELGDVSPTGELAALSKLTANWRSVIEDNVFSAGEQADRKRGQQKLFE